MTTQNKKLHLIFIAVLCFVLMLSIFSYIKINSLIKSADLVNHTTQVTLYLEKLIGNLKDAETALALLLFLSFLALGVIFIFYWRLNKSLIDAQNLKEEATQKQVRIESTKESLKQFQQIFMQSPFSLIYYQGNDFRFELINEKALQAMGKTLQEVSGKSLEEVVPTAKEQGFITLLQQVRHTGIAYEGKDMPFEIEKNGVIQQSWWDFTYTPSRNADGTINGIVAVGIDVTEKVLARKKIEQSEEQLKNILLHAPAATAVFEGPQHRFILANQAYGKQNNRNTKDLLGKSFREVFPELEGTGSFELFDTVYTTGETFTATEYAAMIDWENNGIPTQRYFNFSLEALKNESKEIYGVMVMAYDITSHIEARKKIEESEKKFQAAIAAVEGIIWTNNAVGEMEGEQLGWAKLTGQTFEEYQGYGWAKAIHPDDVQPTINLWNKAVANSSIFEFEHRVNTKQNGYKLFSIKAVPIFDEKRAILQWVGVHTDISVQKDAEEKLAYRTALLEAHNEANIDGILLVDAKGKILSYNQQFVEIWNMPQHIVHAKDDEAALSFAMTQLVNPQQFIDKVQYLYAHPTETCHDELNFKDGKIVERNGYPVVSENGTYYAWSWTFRDITERKNYEKTILESEKQFSTLANNIQNLAWIADSEGWIFWYNKQWYDYTGTTLEEMRGWGWEKVHHPDHIEGVINFVKQAWKKNEPYELTFPLRGVDGNYRWFLTRVFPVNDAEGNILRWVGTNTDIEKQKAFSQQLEEKVNERTIQLNEVNENLEQKNTELQNMNKELEAFTYISSHDLQEPLRKIQTFAGRIIDKEKEHLSENAKDYFNRMNDAASRMQTLIQDLLAFSRVSTSEKFFELTDLSKIVGEVKEEFKEVMEEKNATITIGQMCAVNIIPFQFRQLMHNLIGNALKFSKPNVPSHIIIKNIIEKGSKLNNEKLLPEKKYCYITVIDNGIGFDKQYAEKIFGVFQRLHGKLEYAGTGIGLAIVKKIVDNHNGIIIAESELGKGATFNIYLPV